MPIVPQRSKQCVEYTRSKFSSQSLSPSCKAYALMIMYSLLDPKQVVLEMLPAGPKCWFFADLLSWYNDHLGTVSFLLCP